MYKATLRTRKSRTQGKSNRDRPTGVRPERLDHQTLQVSLWVEAVQGKGPTGQAKRSLLWDKQRQWGWEELQIRVSRVS